MEAQHEREALAGEPGPTLFLRTSEDTLTAWDREKIVDALIRETQLESAAATVIAVEVEQQIQRAHIHTLTTALVRELVSAKLVEHGLLEYRDRHQRLGVPLYDTQQIIQGCTPETVAQDPVATDRISLIANRDDGSKKELLSPNIPPVVAIHVQPEAILAVGKESVAITVYTSRRYLSITHDDVAFNESCRAIAEQSSAQSAAEQNAARWSFGAALGTGFGV